MGSKAKHDIAPKIRAAFFRAIARKGGDEELATLIGNSMDNDFIATLNVISKFTVREQAVTGNIKHDHDHRVTIIQTETQRILDGFASIGDDPSAEVLVPDEPVLPDKSGIQPY